MGTRIETAVLEVVAEGRAVRALRKDAQHDRAVLAYGHGLELGRGQHELLDARRHTDGRFRLRQR